MKDRSTTIDLLLAFAAIFVVTLTCWPETTSQQIVRIRDAEGKWSTYSVAVDDPRLAELEDQLDNWQNVESHPEYVAAKWQHDLAEHYSDSSPKAIAPVSSDVSLAHLQQDDHGSEAAADGVATATLSDTVATVGFEEIEEDSEIESCECEQFECEQEDYEAAETTPSPSSKAYWLSIGESALETMDELTAKSMDPPVVLAAIVPPRIPQIAFHFAFLLGIAGACGHMHWSKSCPVEPSESLKGQNLGVRIRLGTSIGILAVAFICALMIWI